MLFCHKALAYNIAVTNSDGKTIYYSYARDGVSLNVTNYNRTNSLTSVEGSAYTGDIVIPAEVSYGSKTYPVVGITKDAFVNCSSMTSLSLPNSIEFIGEYAFYGCTGLSSFSFPEGLKQIDSGAFFRCTGLTSVDLPSSLEKVGSNIFSLCSSLERLTVADDNPVYDSRENCNAIP